MAKEKAGSLATPQGASAQKHGVHEENVSRTFADAPSSASQATGSHAFDLDLALHMAAAAFHPGVTPGTGVQLPVSTKQRTKLEFLDRDFVKENVSGILKVSVKVTGTFAFSV